MTDTDRAVETIHEFLIEVEHDPEVAPHDARDLLAALPTSVLAAVVAERAEQAEAALAYLIQFVINELDPDPYPDDEHDGDTDSVSWSQYFAEPEHEALAARLKQEHAAQEITR